MRLIALLRAGLLLGLILPAAAQTTSPQDNNTLDHIQLREVDTLFTNPGQGWFVEPRLTPRLPDSVVYLRFAWRQVEPKDGEFDWAFIDKVIQKAHERGATVAMRVMTADAHSTDRYTSPQWLFDEGCNSYPYTNDGTDAAQGGRVMERVEPDYSDPIYLAKHGAFIEALGKRYNGDPNIEFLDIGSYGIWGEWHTTHPASIDVRKQIVDMYVNAFSKTPLVYMSDDAEVMSYALAHGTGLRRDGVGDPWHEARWAGTPAYANVPEMGDAWKHAPIVFEWYLDYNYMKSRGWSFDSAVNFMLRNHVTMIHDNLYRVPKKAMAKMQELARRAGYRFVLHEVTQPKSPHPGDALPVTMDWENVGVGKLYREYTVSIALRNATQETVATTTVAADPRDWLPGKYAVGGSIPLPAALKPGDYSLVVGLFDAANQRPPLHLAIDAPEKDGWYTISHITVH